MTTPTLAETAPLPAAMRLDWAAQTMRAQAFGAIDATAFGICTDTRKGAAGALFFALVGENGDGHRFVAQALAAGAVAAVVSQRIEGVEGTQLVVPDTLRALGDLAQGYRRQFDLPIIAITGSVGKTSTKEMLAAVLRTQFNVLASAKNYNNEIGVPLTLFSLRREHQVAVIEMGMRAAGEIDRLAEIAEPNIGLITNVGFAHIERLGSREGIAKAKTELFARLPVNGTAIVMEGEYAAYLRSQVPAGCRIVRCSLDPALYADVTALNGSGATEEPLRVRVAGEEFEVPLSVVGEHHRGNALLALATAHVLGIPMAQAADALAVWEGAEGRMTLRHTPNGLTVLDDCYNAGPESMTSALATLHRMTGGGGVAVLGDMREMGDYAPGLHFALGPKVVDARLRMLVTVGESTPELVRGARFVAGERGLAVPELHHFVTTQEAAAQIGALMRPGDTVLVKGSRAMEMEQIVTALTGEAAQSGHD